MNLAQRKKTHIHREQTWLSRGRDGRGDIDWEFGTSRYEL